MEEWLLDMEKTWIAASYTKRVVDRFSLWLISDLYIYTGFQVVN